MYLDMIFGPELGIAAHGFVFAEDRRFFECFLALYNYLTDFETE